MKDKYRIGTVIAFLFCGIAVNYMFVTIIMNDNLVLKFWKEILILVLFSVTFFLNFKNEKTLDFVSIALSFFLITLVFSAIVMTENITHAVFVLRIYILPIIVYYIAKNCILLNKEVIYKIFKCIITFYTVICLWGLFQALILGDDFLINIGYPLKYSGRLRDSFYFGGFGNFQRVVSTFSNTNVFATVVGMIIVIFLCNSILLKDIKKTRLKIGIMLMAFILSFSRSNWLAMSFIIILMNMKNTKLINKVILFFILAIFTILILNKITDVNLFRYFKEYIISTLTMQDTSAAGRGSIWMEAFMTFINNPFGIGLGKVGVISSKLTGTMQVVGESSYLAILLDTGIQGFISFITMFFILLKDTNVKYKSSECIKIVQYKTCVKYIIIYILIMFLFSNHIYDLEITIIAMFFIGLGRNKTFLGSLQNDKCLEIRDS